MKFLVIEKNVINTINLEKKQSLREVEVVVGAHLSILCSLEDRGNNNSVDLKRASQYSIPLR